MAHHEDPKMFSVEQMASICERSRWAGIGDHFRRNTHVRSNQGGRKP